jgi:hypothetical protein
MNKNSKLLTILICILGDTTFFFWVYYTFAKLDRFKQLLAQALTIHQMTLQDVAESDLLQLYNVMVNTLLSAIVFFAFFHLIVYALFYFEKKTSIRYVKFVSWMALLTAPFMAFSTREPLLLQISLWLIILPYFWVIREFKKLAPKI